MYSYDRKTVPNAQGVDVKVDLIIQAISSISEIAASFTADVLFSQIWLDPGLSFEHMTRFFLAFSHSLSYFRFQRLYLLFSFHKVE